MRKLDLTGKKFGLLTVIEPDESHVMPNGKKKTMWKCQCECGTITSVQTSNLTTGHTTSCGCKAGRTNIIGERFGKLVVLEYAGNGKHFCLCDCGNEIEVLTYNLKNGNTKSCGCYQKERASEASFKSLIGQRFGKLVVIERTKNNRYGHVCYKCKCDCGGETIVDAGGLRRGTVNSCGCIKSKGEMYIQLYLQEKGINYKSQYSFDDVFLSSGRRPFYDFAIFNKDNKLKCIIEYQGELHYGYTGYGWNTKENFENTQRRDKEKREAMINKNIPLYEIPYWELDNIESILEGIIKDTSSAPDMEEAQEVTEEV